MDVEVNVGPGKLSEMIEFARQVELIGYRRLGIFDSPALFREVWSTIAALTSITHEVVIGSNVTNPLTRHPVVTASAAATIAEFSGDRVYIGIGTGDSGVYNLGYSASPQAMLKDYVLTLRALLEDGRAEYLGKTVHLQWARRPVPIYVAAHGQKAIRLAGQIGDGVIMGGGVTDDVIEGSLNLLAEGARSAGRDVADIDVWWLLPLHVDDRPGQARRDIAWMVASPAHHLARFGLDNKFIPDRFRAGIYELGEIYDITTHGNPTPIQRTQYADIAQRAGVLDYLLDRFFLVGTRNDVRDRIKALIGSGATSLSIGSPFLADLAQATTWARSAHEVLVG